MASAYLKPSQLKVGKNKQGGFAAALLPSNNKGDGRKSPVFTANRGETNSPGPEEDDDHLYNQLATNAHDQETVNSIVLHLRGNQQRNTQIIQSLKHHVQQLSDQLNATREEAKMTIEKMWTSQKQNTASEHQFRLMEDELRQLRLYKKDASSHQQEERDVHARIVDELRAQLGDKEQMLRSTRTSLEDATMRARIQAEGFESEKKQWQQKQGQTINALQVAEQSVMEAAAESHSLAQNVLRLSQENVSLNEQLRLQESKINEVIAAFTAREKDVMNLREENDQLSSALEEATESNKSSISEAAKSSEQLRQMAEKVFSLLGQIQKMEQWKMTALEEQRTMGQKLIMVNTQFDELQNTLHNEGRAKSKLEKELQAQLKSIDELRQGMADAKRKAAMDERQQRQLTLTLKKRTEDFEASQTKQAAVAVQLRNSQQQLEVAKRNAFVAEEKVKATTQAMAQNTARIESLTVAMSKSGAQVGTLTEELKACKELLSKAQATINKLKESKELAAKSAPKVEVPVAQSRSQSVPRVATTRNPREDPAANPKVWLHSLINGPDGSAVVRLMKGMGLDETKLAAMFTKQPQQILLKIAKQYQDIFVQQAMLETEQATCQQALEKLGTTTYKNSDLLLALQSSDQGRIASMSQLFDLLIQIHKIVSNVAILDSPDTDSGSANEDSGKDSRANKIAQLPITSINELLWIIQTLNLSNHGINDKNIDIISKPLSEFSLLHHVNLQRNSLSNEGFVEILKAALIPECSVSTLNVSLNEITFDGLKQLSMLLQKGRIPGVVAAGFRAAINAEAVLSNRPASRSGAGSYATLNQKSDWAQDWTNLDTISFLPEVNNESADEQLEQVISAGVRPILQIVTRNKKLVVNISNNKFDERLLNRIPNLLRVDFDDPELQRIIQMSSEMEDQLVQVTTPNKAPLNKSPGYEQSNSKSNKSQPIQTREPLKKLSQSKSEPVLRPMDSKSRDNNQYIRREKSRELEYADKLDSIDELSEQVNVKLPKRREPSPRSKPRNKPSPYDTKRAPPKSNNQYDDRSDDSRDSTPSRPNPLAKLKNSSSASELASKMALYLPSNSEKRTQPPKSTSSKSPYQSKESLLDFESRSKSPYTERTASREKTRPDSRSDDRPSSRSEKLNPYLSRLSQVYAIKDPKEKKGKPLLEDKLFQNRSSKLANLNAKYSRGELSSDIAGSQDLEDLDYS